MGESGDDLALDRDSMGVDLLVKRLAEGDNAFSGIVRGRGLIVIVEPKSNPVEMKTRPVGDRVATGLIVGAKKDGRCEAPLEALHHAAIMAAVFGKTKEVQHLSGAVEADDSGSPVGQRVSPPRSE